MTNFPEKLSGFLDLGNAEQMKAFDDFASASTDSQKLSSLESLLLLLLARQSPSPRASASDDVVGHLLLRLQQCVTTFQAFAAGADPFNFDSSDPVRQQFLRAEAKAVRLFISRHDLKVPSTDSLRAYAAVRREMEETQDIESLRQNFFAICAMWELQLTVNSQLVKFASKADGAGEWQERAGVIETQFNDLKQKVVEMKGATQKLEKARITETSQLRAELAKKEKELEELQTLRSSHIRQEQQNEIDAARVRELLKRITGLESEVNEVARLRTENARLRTRIRELAKRGPRPPQPAGGDPMLARFAELESEIDSLYDAVRSAS
jgi:DNA polymerase III alpha subunit